MGGAPRGEVPPEPSGFVGREHELRAVCTVLETSPLVTLTGPGGVGKTRIALRAAHELGARFPGGIGFVELSGMRDEALLPGTVADALGLHDAAAAASPARLVRSLAGRRFLLILDTCEHLVTACAALVRSLRESCPRLRVLVTSRQPLGVRGEFVLPVQPLSLPVAGADGPEAAATTEPDARDAGDAPDLDDVGGAVALFALRAEEAVPGFTLPPEQLRDVVVLCRRLDGIPLAIELAAAQLRHTPLDKLVRQLDGLFWTLEAGPEQQVADEDVRHQALRTTVGWSHELCTPLERLLWVRLAVFTGGFDQSMAIEVCADERLDRAAVVSCLAGLVEKSIVQRVSATRYDMLDTIREYGAVWLEAVEPIGPLLARHRDCVARLATRAAASWLTDHQLHWAHRVEAERDNIRAALEFCFGMPGEERAGLRLAARLWSMWLCRSRYTEARHWLERGLDLVTDPVPERAEALWKYAYLLTHHGESRTALPLIAESMKLTEQAGDTAGYARALRTLAAAAMFMGDAERAHRCFAEGAGLLTAPGVRADLAMLRVLWAYQYESSGDHGAALEQCDEVLRLLRDAPAECWMRSWAGYVKALTYLNLGDDDRCAAELRSCLEMFGRMDDPAGLANCCEMLGWVYARQRRYAEGAILLGAASRHPDPVNVPRLSVLRPGTQGADLERRVREALGSERFAAHRLHGRSLSVAETIRVAGGEPPSL